MQINRIKWRMFLGVLLLLLLTNQCPAADKENANFLALSDIHFDPFNTCGLIRPCPILIKLEEQPASAWPTILKQYDFLPITYNHDTNYFLLRSALIAAAQTYTQTHSQFVIELGDFLSHGFHEKYNYYSVNPANYSAFVHKTMEFLNQQLQDAFPAANIYMTIGNNDSYQNDYINYPKGPFYHDMAELWSGLLHDPTSKNSFNHEFPEGGYYALDIAAQPNIRLIVLNSVLFSTKIQGPGVTKAAEDELAWLEGEFAHLRKSQKILIVMHIPIGTDVFTSLKFHPFVATELWQTQFSQEFLKILRDHPNQIMGILAAHFHKDWFAVLNPDILSAHPIPISGVPSVSPIFGNNPTYRVYQVSADLQQLADFTTYYLPLAKPLQWLTEYHFNAVYQPLCYHCQITAGMERLKRQGLLAQYYLAYYDTQIASAPTRLYWQPFYWCTVHHVTKEDYLNCINTNFTSKFGNIPA